MITALSSLIMSNLAGIGLAILCHAILNFKALWESWSMQLESRVCQWRDWHYGLSSCKAWLKQRILYQKPYTTWMKVGLQWVMLKLHSILLILQFDKDFRQSLAVRNGLRLWNIFMRMEVHFHRWLYSRVRNCYVNEYLLIFLIVGDLDVIQNDGQAMNMGSSGCMKSSSHWLEKRLMESLVF